MQETSQKPLLSHALNATVIVAALGYFVDIYDLQLFNVVSKPSIQLGLGITDPKEIDRLDYVLFLWQMAGMLIGGLLWGIMGDLKGRKSILFGSILLYSVANILNGFVTTIEQYEAVRLLAGLGLAGELGAAITLVSEVMTRENRGYGTMVIVTTGALGAVAAALISKHFAWNVAYFIGGGLGLMLLFLRFGTFESGMFEEVQQQNVKKGNFLLFFSSLSIFWKYLCCILIGLPVWYVIGIFIKFSVKFSALIGISSGKVEIAYAVMYAYIGLSFGDLVSGWLSQIFKSRKKVVMGYLIGTVVLVLIFLNLHQISAGLFYFFCFLLGTATGYWALFVTIASEQFGTNIRATATTTVPNFVRGAVIPITLSFTYLAGDTFDRLYSASLIVGAVCIGLAMIATMSVEETFGKDLNYLEE